MGGGKQSREFLLAQQHFHQLIMESFYKPVTDEKAALVEREAAVTAQIDTFLICYKCLNGLYVAEV